MRTTSSQREIAAEILGAATALAARARAERAGELTLGQVAALGRVATQGPITPGEVAAQLGVLPQSLTRTLAGLEAADLVRREPDPADGRQTLLRVTKAGRLALRAEMSPRDRWLAREMTTLLTEDERARLAGAAELMRRLATFDSDLAPPVS